MSHLLRLLIRASLNLFAAKVIITILVDLYCRHRCSVLPFVEAAAVPFSSLSGSRDKVVGCEDARYVTELIGKEAVRDRPAVQETENLLISLAVHPPAPSPNNFIRSQ